MIMELVEGRTLHDILAAGRISLADAVRYSRDALDGLAAAHERGVVHRDIKPANMMIAGDGSVKLMDFGIARLATDSQLTKTGFTMGSLFYMSPEQINAVPLDHRSDIYSMGVTLYQLVTGRRPFEGTSEYSIMAAHLNEAPTPPAELDPSLPPQLSQIILAALEKDPAKRFQSAGAMRNALSHVLNGLQEDSAPGKPAVGKPAVPAMAAAAVAAPPPQPAPPSGTSRAPNGMRVLYILAGSLATLAVLIFGAIQIPKMLSTHAVEPPAPNTPASDPAPAPPAPPSAETEASTPIADPAPTQAPAAAPQATTPPRAPGTPAVADSPRPAPPPAVAARPEPATATQTAAAQPAQAASTPTTPAPAPAAPPPGDTALREARERIVLLATRVGAVRSSLERLKQSQARMGLGLRQDWAAAEQRLLFRMDEAEKALAGRDAGRTGQQLDAAERELSALERGLGL
jgi:serine/threonine-protein kinase